MADVRRALRGWGEENPPGLYLVALSGGGDSLALAWAAGKELPALGFQVGAVIVDHQLQQGSAEVAHRAALQAEECGLSPVVIKTVRVRRGKGPEEAARTARYQALSEALGESGARGILLAHTEDDQAETVLMGLVRGSGPSSLKGMARSDGLYHRPLLEIPRHILRQALRDAGLSWWEDPHNDDEAFLRVRVRNSVLPVLEKELGPGVPGALSRTARLFREDSEALDDMAKKRVDALVSFSKNTASVEVEELLLEPLALSTRIVRSMISGVGGRSPRFDQMTQVMALVHSWRGQSVVSLTGASVERVDNRLVVRAKHQAKD